MKVLGFLVFLASGLLAQAPPPQAPPPALPDIPDDAVIAVFDDGVKFTMGQYRAIYSALPGNQQAMAQNRRVFLEQFALIRKLAHMAEEEKLDQSSPAKDLIEYYRMFFLGQAKLNHEIQNQNVEPDEIAKYYAANKERYKEVKVKAIYITFSKAQASQVSNSGKKLLTEEDAKAKAETLVAEARAGADFVKLARENSDDAPSREKDGDFDTLKAAEREKLPAPVANAILALKQGEISDVIAQPNGFYVFRADQVTYRPEAEVQGEIMTNLQQEHFQHWMDRTHDAAKVQFPNPAFLGEAPAAPK
jgi:parvulin-like peptidyl-prolyl isomerase